MAIEENGWNLPVAFYFQVTIGNDVIAFKEVSGLESEMELETIQEGGSNEFEYKVPKQVKHGNLVLKRAMLPADHTVVNWFNDVLSNGLSVPIVPANIKISLLDKEENPVYNWDCLKAFPVKWQVDSLDAEKNSVLIETMEFAYQSIVRSS